MNRRNESANSGNTKLWSQKPATEPASAPKPPPRKQRPTTPAAHNGKQQQPLSLLDPRSLWRSYVYLLGRYPWSAQILSGAFLSTMSSLIAECIVLAKPFSQVDWSVPARMTFMGVCVFGPIIRTWMMFLERLVPGAAGWAGVKKMVIDQTVMAPILMAAFTASFILLNGGSLQDAADKLKRDGWTMLKNNWKFWPAVQLVSFYLVPFNLRMFFMQVVMLVWNVYIAFMFSSSNMPSTSNSTTTTSEGHGTSNMEHAE